MRKILLAVVIVLMLAVPAVAEAPVTVIVDGEELSTPGLLINDATYVPLRAVSESLGAKVEWDGRAVISTLGRPVITGDESQKAMVEAALNLLKEKDPADYELVCRYVKSINVTDSVASYSLGQALIETRENPHRIVAEKINLTPLLLEKYDTVYTASTIAHEATHLCNALNDSIRVNDKADENIAFLHQITVLRILGASKSLIDGTEAIRLEVIR
jgi:hypothetical protein